MTVIYYTSNREDESFEAKIKEQLKKSCGERPIISVSQKPIDLGHNICVGKKFASNHNTKRQVMIGLEQAKTENVYMAEADFLYPKEYFEFVPSTKNHFYYLNSLYVFLRNKFRKKSCSDGAIVCNRDFLLDALAEALEGTPEWWDGAGTEPVYGGRMKGNSLLTGKRDRIPFRTEVPGVTFKTGNGVSIKCPYSRRSKPLDKIPYWGDCREFRT